VREATSDFPITINGNDPIDDPDSQAPPLFGPIPLSPQLALNLKEATPGCPIVTNGNGRVNGNGNGHTNGHTNGNGHSASSAGCSADTAKPFTVTTSKLDSTKRR
jgi:hypothetical protein